MFDLYKESGRFSLFSGDEYEFVNESEQKIDTFDLEGLYPSLPGGLLLAKFGGHFYFEPDGACYVEFCATPVCRAAYRYRVEASPEDLRKLEALYEGEY